MPSVPFFLRGILPLASPALHPDKPAMLRILAPAALIAAAALVPSTAFAEKITLERLFASPAIAGPTPRLLKLSPDGRLATLLRNRPDDAERFDLWAIDTRTGKARMLVDSRKVGTGAALSEAEKMQRERLRIGGSKGIVAYDWAPDGQHILVPLDGDLYLADLAGGVQRLTDSPETELDATVSDKGRFVSYVREGNLHVIDIASRGDRALTTDGGGTTSWGVAEFVANEELDRRRGHWWAPDDSLIAVARVDESKVEVSSRAAIGAEGTTLFQQRYPRAGTPNAAVDLWLMKPDGSGRVKADLGTDPDIYIARVNWLPDASAILVQRLNRAQDRLDMLRVDARTGASTVLFSETAETWVNVNGNLHALRDGGLIWSSERDGYDHLYLWKDGAFRQLTHGKWAVEKLVGVDEKAGQLFFTGFADSTLEQHLYALDYRQGGEPRRLTAAGTWNDAVMDGAAARAIVTTTRPDQPKQVWLADAAGKRLAWIEENAVKGSHPLAPYVGDLVKPAYGTIKAADGATDLDYAMLVPPGLKPGEKAPAFVFVYGGPHAHTVKRDFFDLRMQYLAQQGWVVFMLDNRGMGDRGKAFEDPIHLQMGKPEVADQLKGVEWLKAQPFVDPAKVAVMGWSYGGYMTLKLLEAAPGTFAAGVSVAPVTRWELYDTAYTERYLGNPAKDKAPYDGASALDNATAIADPLLLVHGMADDNVLFEHSTALMAKLQDASKPFETMVYPGKTHSISGQATSLHLWRTIEAFLNRTVKAAK
ncbi:Prolyl tripeptidyl peptidase precursor [Sphingomonas haloaromaticamans]|uniref:Prolyl tripeptidyl peptidase n=2 Tax=Edaphosphingomonas haloaromaticamans TaxID=653954 RepID=A0A1S1HIG5_9SPHN|nr:Prolyl tripeptidyl peptidase precursor [Sphingomonas haloaromaticamans]